MIISEKNSDKWFFDYHEGNLSRHEQIEVEQFVKQNPHLQEEFEAWGNSFLPTGISTASYGNVSKLKRSKTFINNRQNNLIALLCLLLMVGVDWSSIGNNSNGEPFVKGKVLDFTESVDNKNAQLLVNTVANQKQLDFRPHENELFTRTVADVKSQSSDNNFSLSTVERPSEIKLYQCIYDESNHRITILHSYNNEKSNDQWNTLKAIRQIEQSEVNSKNSKLNTTGRKHRIVMRRRNLGFKNLGKPVFYHENQNIFAVNAGLINFDKHSTIRTNMRLSRPSSQDALVVNQLSYNQYIRFIKGGIGVSTQYSSYQDGMLRNLEVNLMYASSIKLSRTATLNPSVNFGFGSIRSNFSKVNYKDIGLGVLLNTNSFQLGLSAQHIFEPKASPLNNNSEHTKIARAFTVFGGTDYKIPHQNITLSPQLVYMQQGTNKELWANTTLRYNWLMVGAGLSTDLSTSVLLGFTKAKFGFNYSFDWTKSSLAQQYFPSHEFCIRLTLGAKNANELIFKPE